MSVYDIVEDLANAALNRSKIYNEGSENYAFAFGWLKSELQANLDNMNLDYKQLKVLTDRISKLENIK